MKNGKVVVLLKENGVKGICQGDCRKEVSFANIVLIYSDGEREIEPMSYCLSCLQRDGMTLSRRLLMRGIQSAEYILARSIEEVTREGIIVCCSE